MMKFAFAILSAALFILSFSCGDDSADDVPAPAVSQDDAGSGPSSTSQTGEGTEAPTQAPTTAPTATATSVPPTPTSQPLGTSRQSPAPIGTPLEVGGWTITVNSVTPNATDVVLAENLFNDPPDEGRQFFIASITATYNGDEESASFFGDVSLAALGPSAVAYEGGFEDSCGVVPNELDTFVEVFSGGTIEGNICWSVLEEDAAQLLMFAEEFFTFDDTRFWFALQ